MEGISSRANWTSTTGPWTCATVPLYSFIPAHTFPVTFHLALSLDLGPAAISVISWVMADCLARL